MTENGKLINKYVMSWRDVYKERKLSRAVVKVVIASMDTTIHRLYMFYMFYTDFFKVELH